MKRNFIALLLLLSLLLPACGSAPAPAESAAPTPPSETAVPETPFEAAERLMAEGEFRAARELLLESGDGGDASALADKCLEGIYAAAVESLYNCRFYEAEETLEYLGEYADAPELLSQCRRRIALEENPPEHSFLSRYESGAEYERGILYEDDYAYVYLPYECNAETKVFVFYPGGAEEQHFLPVEYIQAYLDLSEPNALLLFFQTAGFPYYTKRNMDAVDIIEDIAAEKGFFVHDISVCGASAGCYPALHAAAQYYSYGGYRVVRAISLDAANEWDNTANLKPEELDIIAHTGTELYLFEQPKVGLEMKPIQAMVDHNCYVTLVKCSDLAHDRIAFNSFTYGVFDFALCLTDETGMRPGEYELVNINDNRG